MGADRDKSRDPTGGDMNGPPDPKTEGPFVVPVGSAVEPPLGDPSGNLLALLPVGGILPSYLRRRDHQLHSQVD